MLPWLSNFLDLNPIEHLRGVLDQQMQSIEAPAHTLQDLKALLLMSWYQWPQEHSEYMPPFSLPIEFNFTERSDNPTEAMCSLMPHCKTILIKLCSLGFPVVWAVGFLVDGATEVRRELQPLSCPDREARSLVCQLSQDRPTHGLSQRVLRTPQTAGGYACAYVNVCTFMLIWAQKACCALVNLLGERWKLSFLH